VTFKVDDEEYGVDILKVREIIRTAAITKVPRAPRYVEGLIDLRGKVIPIVGLRGRMNLPGRDHDNKTRIVVATLSGAVVGFVVDSVSEVLRVPESAIEAAPAVLAGQSDFTCGIGRLGDRLLVLVDLDKILEDVDLPVA
jgi:purine-binding chemotaxis protein CheW